MTEIENFSVLCFVTLILFSSIGSCHAENNIARIFDYNLAKDHEDWGKYSFLWEPSYNPGMCSAFKRLNNDSILITYASALASCNWPTNPNSYNYTFLDNSHPEWFLRNSSGGKITLDIGGVTWIGCYYLDIGNTSFQKWASDEVIKKIVADTGVYGNGIVLDNVVPYVFSAYVSKYSQSEWTALWSQYLSLLKSKLNERGYLLIINLGMSSRETSFKSNMDAFFNNVDGYTSEVFLNSMSESYDYRNIGEADWLADVNNTVWASKQKGKIAILISMKHRMSQDDLAYLYGSFLLAKNNKTFFDALDFDVDPVAGPLVYGYHDLWQSLWDYNLGDPVGEMYKADGLYQRYYTLARVIVNPSDSFRSLNLNGNYYTTGGVSVSSLTLPTKSAKILLTYQCVSHASKQCYDNDIYWNNSCGIREELYQDCGTDLCRDGYCVKTSGLLGHWRFDSFDNAMVLDSSAFRNDGVYTNLSVSSGALAGGKAGKSIQFNGVDYIAIHHLRGISGIRTDFTVSYWVKRSSETGGYQILKYDAFGYSDLGSNAYAFLTVHVNETGGVIYDWMDFVTNKTPMNEWHYISLTRDGSVKSVYVDGILVHSISNRSSYPLKQDDSNSAISSIFVGYSGDWGNNKFKGAIDDLRIYDRALSADEIAGLYQSYNGSLAGYWKLDSADNNNVVDYSAYKSGGRYINPSNASASMIADNWTGNAIRFNGSDYINISSVGISSVKTGLTISYWVKRSLDGGGYHVLKMDAFGSTDAGGNAFALWTNHVGGYDWFAFATDWVKLNEWHYVTFTWAGGNKSMYVDGTLVQTVTGLRSDDLNNWEDGPLILGNSRGWHDPNFRGGLSEVKIYDRALSANEVLNLYHSYLTCVPGTASGCKVCNLNGSNWTDDNSRCPAGQTCVNGNCSASTTTSTTTTSTSSSSSTSTTSTTMHQCVMPGNNPPCGEITLSEIVAAINRWAADEFDLGGIVDLINSWADLVSYPPV